jgi:hypothetical protein
VLQAAALSFLGRWDEARAAARRVLELEPGFTISSFVRAHTGRAEIWEPIGEALLPREWKHREEIATMSHFTSWHDYESFARSVRMKNRYIRSAAENSFLEAVRLTVKDRILPLQAGWQFWRAQRGYCMGFIELDHQDGTIAAARPYPPERMKPRPNQVSEGRVNPKGIPCLYGATSLDTAVAEVRPWKLELVSVAKFTLCRSVKLIECLKYHNEPRYPVFMSQTYVPLQSDIGEIVSYVPETPSDEAITKHMWTHIDQASSEPVTHHVDYVPTQILAELFKREEYDGILYQIKFSDQGYNVAFFSMWQQ